MSRAFRNIQGHFIVFLITLCLLAVCNMQTVYADENTEAVSINIPESIEINKYTVYTLDPEILPLSADQHFNVESSNPNVVQADISGIISALTHKQTIHSIGYKQTLLMRQLNLLRQQIPGIISLLMLSMGRR